MSDLLSMLLIPAIGYFGWSCGRAFGGSGYAIFMAALTGVASVVFLSRDTGANGYDPSGPSVLVMGLACALAVLSGAFGVAKRRAALQSAGVKTPKSG